MSLLLSISTSSLLRQYLGSWLVEIILSDSLIDTRSGKSVIQKEVAFDSGANSSAMLSISFSLFQI